MTRHITQNLEISYNGENSDEANSDEENGDKENFIEQIKYHAFLERAIYISSLLRE